MSEQEKKNDKKSMISWRRNQAKVSLSTYKKQRKKFTEKELFNKRKSEKKAF